MDDKSKKIVKLLMEKDKKEKQMIYATLFLLWVMFALPNIVLWVVLKFAFFLFYYLCCSQFTKEVKECKKEIEDILSSNNSVNF